MEVSPKDTSIKKYQKVGDEKLHCLKFKDNAYLEAKYIYERYSKIPFYRDLMYYLRTGFVLNQPNLFAMYKVIERDGRRGWFVQICVGNLVELVCRMPMYLPFIAFCRKGDNNMRVIELQPFLDKVAATMKERA